MVVQVMMVSGGAVLYDEKGVALMVTVLSAPLLSKMRGRLRARFHARWEDGSLQLEDEAKS